MKYEEVRCNNALRRYNCGTARIALRVFPNHHIGGRDFHRRSFRLRGTEMEKEKIFYTTADIAERYDVSISVAQRIMREIKDFLGDFSICQGKVLPSELEAWESKRKQDILPTFFFQPITKDGKRMICRKCGCGTVLISLSSTSKFALACTKCNGAEFTEVS